MKKIVVFVLMAAVMAGVAACGRSASPPPEVELYLPCVNAPGPVFTTKYAETDGSATRIVALLVKQGALPEGCAALSYENGVLDMNWAFAWALCLADEAEVERLLGCVVNTFVTYYGLDRIRVTAEGRRLESCFDVYDEPLAFIGVGVPSEELVTTTKAFR